MMPALCEIQKETQLWLQSIAREQTSDLTRHAGLSPRRLQCHAPNTDGTCRYPSQTRPSRCIRHARAPPVPWSGPRWTPLNRRCRPSGWQNHERACQHSSGDQPCFFTYPPIGGRNTLRSVRVTSSGYMPFVAWKICWRRFASVVLKRLATPGRYQTGSIAAFVITS